MKVVKKSVVQRFVNISRRWETEGYIWHIQNGQKYTNYLTLMKMNVVYKRKDITGVVHSELR